MGLASPVAVLVAPNFLALLNQAVDDAFGTILPAIPFGALLSVLFVLRWRELRDILSNELGLTTEIPTRLIGLGILASLVLMRGLTGQSVYLSAIAVISALYGTSLIVNPLTRRITLPYASIYAVGVAAPAALQWAFGEPLAALSSSLSAGMITLSGIPLTWQGTQFQVMSRTGDVVSATITPGCSSIVSVTTFLGLLALMHIDLRKDLPSTIKLAAVGVAALTILNAVRITVLVWVGYAEGAATFWGVHNWVGYVLFLGFYLITLTVYPRMGQQAAPGHTALTRLT
jgi:exosortase/archaeosortase family protein